MMFDGCFLLFALLCLGEAFVSRDGVRISHPEWSRHSNVQETGLLVDEGVVLRFGGVGRLYENDILEQNRILLRLQCATVAIVGLGGVGSWAAEALCRSAIGNLVLIDLDDICISNVNRQLHANSGSVGQMKIDEMKRRLTSINPHCNVTLIHDFVSKDNVHDIIEPLGLTAVLDAIDGSKSKSALLAACTDLEIPVVTCAGAAGRTDPTQIRCEDITKVVGDKLIRTCRSEMRKRYKFSEGLSLQETQKGRKAKKWNIDCIYSLENQKIVTESDGQSSFRRCDGALGTACHVTGTVGFCAAGRIVERIAQNSLNVPQR